MNPLKDIEPTIFLTKIRPLNCLSMRPECIPRVWLKVKNAVRNSYFVNQTDRLSGRKLISLI